MELTRARLYHLLADDAAEHGAHGVDVAPRGLGEESHDAVGIDVVNLRSRGLRVVDALRVRHHRSGIGVVTGLGERPVVLRHERFERGEADVKHRPAIELGEIAEQKLPGLVHRLLQGLKRQTLGLLHLRGDAAADVRAETGGIALVKLERVRLDVLDLAGNAVVELRHAAHLGEDDALPVLELDAFVVDARHQRRRVVGDGGDDARVGSSPSTSCTSN